MPSLLFLVEDEPLVRMTVEAALEDAGYEIQAAGSGREAVTLLDAEIDKYAALITDVNLGDMTGWDVARHARSLKPKLPVIYVTGDSAHEWSAHGVPGSLLVEKPFVPVQIVTAVSSLLTVSDPTQLA